MVMNAKAVKGSGVAQPAIEPGVYPGRVVQIINFGLQAQRPYKGQDKPPAQEIGITYELVDTFIVDANGEEQLDKPRWVSENFPLRSPDQDKAKSTQRMEAFDPVGAFDWDFSKCGDIPVNVTVVNNRVGDKVYNNIAGVAPMRPKDAAKCPNLVHPVLVFDVDEPDMEAFATLPQWIQEKIKGNLHYNGSKLQASIEGKTYSEPAEGDESEPW